MDNYTIADNFSLLSKLMDIHGEDSFKAKSFASASFTIEKLPGQLKETAPEDIARIKGIGSSTNKAIQEMLKIKGLGPKKIATIWKELEVETLGELLYACDENRLTLLKGFGQKTQDSVQQSIEFYFSNRERFLYAEVATLALDLEKRLQQALAPAPVSLTGHVRRTEIIIDEIALVAGAAPTVIQQHLGPIPEFKLLEETMESQLWQHEQL